MKCTRCDFENEDRTSFCGNCGSSMVISRPYPSAAAPINERLTCSKCGSPNPDDSIYCERCGTKLFAQAVAFKSPIVSNSGQTLSRKTSGAWWLLPIFLFWLGGLIGWLAVKEKDRSKASRLLWFGVGWTFIFWIPNILIAIQSIKSSLHF